MHLMSKPMILIENVQASKTTTRRKKKKKLKKNNINQSKIPIGKPHNVTSGES